MKTSYYAISMSDPNAVSIAGRAPAGYKGREYKKLAPKYWFFKKYKEGGDKDFYKEQYQKEVLNKLDPKEVYEELGEEAVLLCYEKPTDFCHRHLVAEWLNKSLNLEIEITEIAEDRALDALIALTLRDDPGEVTDEEIEEFMRNPPKLSPEDKKALNGLKLRSPSLFEDE